MNSVTQNVLTNDMQATNEVPCILIRVEDRDIHTQQFSSFEAAQSQMIDEMMAKAGVPQATFDKWNGSLMVEDEYGNWAFWSDGGYRKSRYLPIDWQIVEVEV